MSGVGSIKTSERDRLVSAAKEASASAYSPYSKVKVGAALLTDDGKMYTGCNVENASYGLTICAERTAAVKAVSAGSTRFRALAIASNLAGTASPCGACRQFLSEFGRGMRVYLVSYGGRVSSHTLDELLPMAFGLGDMR